MYVHEDRIILCADDLAGKLVARYKLKFFLKYCERVTL